MLIEALVTFSCSIADIMPRADGISAIGPQADVDAAEGFNSIIDDVRQTFVNNGAE